MQTLDELNDAFSLPDVLSFDEPYPGMPRARITTPACTAELYLQGAQLTQWQPAGAEPVLFLSERSVFSQGKAIRGGIPVIFPWFGAPANSSVHPPREAPSHGFARTGSWTLRFAAFAGDDLHLSLTLDRSDSMPGAAQFKMLQLGIDLVLGRTLQVRLLALNTSAEVSALPARFEEALHTYFLVGDLKQVSIEGLGGTEFLDKTDQFRRKSQIDPVIRFEGETDRPYLNTTTPVTLVDEAMGRRITAHKTNSNTTVLWNPAAELTSRLPDLAPDAWEQFVCVEAANAAENCVVLAPGEAHAMTLQVELEAL